MCKLRTFAKNWELSNLCDSKFCHTYMGLMKSRVSVAFISGKFNNGQKIHGQSSLDIVIPPSKIVLFINYIPSNQVNSSSSIPPLK